MPKKIRSFRLYLKDIIEAIEKIQVNVQKGEDNFFGDENTQDSIVRKMEIIGEASNKIPESYRKIILKRHGEKL